MTEAHDLAVLMAQRAVLAAAWREPAAFPAQVQRLAAVVAEVEGGAPPPYGAGSPPGGTGAGSAERSIGLEQPLEFRL